jgi:hypothetical protein
VDEWINEFKEAMGIKPFTFTPVEYNPILPTVPFPCKPDLETRDENNRHKIADLYTQGKVTPLLVSLEGIRDRFQA